MADPVTAILAAAAVASGLVLGALLVAIVARSLVGATRPPAAHAHGWAERVDPDHLIPAPLRRPGVLVVVDGGRVREVRRG